MKNLMDYVHGSACVALTGIAGLLSLYADDKPSRKLVDGVDLAVENVRVVHPTPDSVTLYVDVRNYGDTTSLDTALLVSRTDPNGTFREAFRVYPCLSLAGGGDRNVPIPIGGEPDGTSRFIVTVDPSGLNEVLGDKGGRKGNNSFKGSYTVPHQ